MKYIHVYALFLMFVFCTSCGGQNKTDPPKENIKSETKDVVTANYSESQLEQLHSLKVDDKIIIRSRNVSHAPKYAYPIVSGDYVERDSKIIYKRIPRKGGC